MALTKVPNKILSSPCTPLSASSLKKGEFTSLIVDLRDAMKKNNGIGLAANQFGHHISLFVIDESLAAEYEVPNVFANPEITEYGKETEPMEEGCLSIPGLWVPIHRSKKIMFKALDEHGTKIKFRARGMLARVLQHETDHLQGMTIQNRASEQSR